MNVRVYAVAVAVASLQLPLLLAAAEEMPADKYGYRPTPAQMSFARIVVHLAEGNDYLCGTIAGVKAPERVKVDTADSKDKLVARPASRASVILVTVGDWADHYSQAANYLRLNGQLPPTAKRQTP